MSRPQQFTNEYDYQDATLLSDKDKNAPLRTCLNGETHMLIFTNVFKVAKTPNDFIKHKLIPALEKMYRSDRDDTFTTGPTMGKFQKLKNSLHLIKMQDQKMICVSKIQFFISPGCFGRPRTFTIQIISDQSIKPKSMVVLRCDIKYPDEVHI